MKRITDIYPLLYKEENSISSGCLSGAMFQGHCIMTFVLDFNPRQYCSVNTIGGIMKYSITKCVWISTKFIMKNKKISYMENR